MTVLTILPPNIVLLLENIKLNEIIEHYTKPCAAELELYYESILDMK